MLQSMNTGARRGVLILGLVLAGVAHAAGVDLAAGPSGPFIEPSTVLKQSVPAPQLDARSWLVVDLTSNQILAEHAPDLIEAPASLTKLMTAYLTFQALHDGRLSPQQKITENVEAWRTGGSRMFIDPRVPVSVDDLLMGMIVQSGNDAAMTLAQAVAGSTQTFVSMMNRQAQQWGLKNTHFMDPTGLPDPGHHSTARDLAVIASHVIRDFPDDYARYFKVKDFTYNRITQPNRVGLLFTDPSVDGMKTGYTEDAGYCMITSAQRQTPSGGRRVLTVVLGTPSESARVSESGQLVNWAFQNFDDVRLAQPNQALAQARVWKGALSQVGLGSPQVLAVTVPRGQAQQVKVAVQRPDPLVAPIQKGQSIGTLRASLGGAVVAEHPLVALQAVPAAGVFKRMWDALRLAIH